jgi:hypothetical protein
VNTPDHWYCCLALPERELFRFLAVSLPETLYQGVPVALYDAERALFGLTPDVRRDSFERIYHVAHGHIVVDEEEVEVVLPEEGYLDLWVSNTLFILTPAAACTDGCPLSERPTP